MSSEGNRDMTVRVLGDCNDWDVEIKRCVESGEQLISARLENPQYSASTKVLVAKLPDGTDTTTLTPCDALQIIADADRIAIGGSYFGHPPEWAPNKLGKMLLEDTLRRYQKE